ncbi:hypothetical protein GEMRC1_010140 [Eukaryota sp. GEM-RC1]
MLMLFEQYTFLVIFFFLSVHAFESSCSGGYPFSVKQPDCGSEIVPTSTIEILLTASCTNLSFSDPPVLLDENTDILLNSTSMYLNCTANGRLNITSASIIATSSNFTSYTLNFGLDSLYHEPDICFLHWSMFRCGSNTFSTQSWFHFYIGGTGLSAFRIPKFICQPFSDSLCLPVLNSTTSFSTLENSLATSSSKGDVGATVDSISKLLSISVSDILFSTNSSFQISSFCLNNGESYHLSSNSNLNLTLHFLHPPKFMFKLESFYPSFPFFVFSEFSSESDLPGSYSITTTSWDIQKLFTAFQTMPDMIMLDIMFHLPYPYQKSWFDLEDSHPLKSLNVTELELYLETNNESYYGRFTHVSFLLSVLYDNYWSIIITYKSSFKCYSSLANRLNFDSSFSFHGISLKKSITYKILRFSDFSFLHPSISFSVRNSLSSVVYNTGFLTFRILIIYMTLPAISRCLIHFGI